MMRGKNMVFARPIARRTLLKGGLAGAVQIASPFVMAARGEAPVKLGMIEPLTGVYAKLAKAEVAGAQLALDEVNQSGGFLGREAQLLIADSANDVATGVAKAGQLIDRDGADFILGDVNSAVALAVMRVTEAKRKLHVVTGGHTDEITGIRCSWNVFRICKTTTMEANAIAETLIKKFGKRWYFLTPDYIYGYTLQAAFERKLRDYGGAWAGERLPLGTVDYSQALTDAGEYRPQVLINLMGGDDQANSLQQIVRFGLNRDMAIGGALFELESILSVPDAARIGWWTMEWWWNQPDNPRVKAFDDAIRRRTGAAASARNWFGYAAVHALASVANQQKSLNSQTLARALQGYTLAPEVALAPDRAFFREGDHQLMSASFVGEVHPAQGDAFDVFTTRAVVAAGQVAEPAGAGGGGCGFAFPG
jgi:branched-chain amino acid transport system substrate-binding protein